MFDSNGNLDIRLKISLYITGIYISYNVYKKMELDDDLLEFNREQFKIIRNNIKKLTITDNPIVKKNDIVNNNDNDLFVI